MRLAPTMEKVVTPLMAQHGFELFHKGAGEYKFRNGPLTRMVIFRVVPRMGKLIEVSFQNLAPHRFRLSLGQFPGEPSGCYSSQAELDHLLIHYAEVLVERILPYWDILDRTFIDAKSSLYTAPSQDTQQRAREFSEKYCLPMTAEKFNLLSISWIVQALRPGKIEECKAAFARHKEDLLNAAVYLGEITRIVRPEWYWGWQSFEGIPIETSHERPIIQNFGLKEREDDTSLHLDALRRILSNWNFPQLEAYSVSKYLIGTC